MGANAYVITWPLHFQCHFTSLHKYDPIVDGKEENPILPVAYIKTPATSHGIPARRALMARAGIFISLPPSFTSLAQLFRSIPLCLTINVRTQSLELFLSKNIFNGTLKYYLGLHPEKIDFCPKFCI